ncbi:MAG TPA: PIN domain-containing protein [Nitrospira sp.]|nr:PIN domain-containing protein [Nitrospira sp.]
MVLIDTSIWSLALRRSSSALNETQVHLVARWKELVRDGQAALIGPIRQEMLSGLQQREAFETLRTHLAPFDDVPLMRNDYEEAAGLFNLCRSHGLTGTAIDLLICAVACRLQTPIFTIDQDFLRYRRQIPIRLYEPRLAFQGERLID